MSLDPVPSPARSGFRPWMVIAPVGVIAVAGLGLLALRTPLPGPTPVGADRMAVEVVAPVEPTVEPGGAMEVGDLVDGYTHVAIAPAEPADVYDAGYETAWVEPLPPLPEPRATAWRSDGAAARPTQDQAEVTRSGGQFGFDAPGPDYAAERRARQARLDRIQAEQAAQGRAGAPMTGADLDRDSAFY
ncbi:hypothetical protein [Brevundimonas sp.]|uniref:hypothetical protein n=1 Tax=Brevundimonas sp. TaxID=1871086 RepID=UPI003F706458